MGTIIQESVVCNIEDVENTLTVDLSKIRPVIPVERSSEKPGTFINPITTSILFPVGVQDNLVLPGYFNPDSVIGET